MRHVIYVLWRRWSNLKTRRDFRQMILWFTFLLHIVYAIVNFNYFINVLHKKKKIRTPMCVYTSVLAREKSGSLDFISL